MEINYWKGFVMMLAGLGCLMLGLVGLGTWLGVLPLAAGAALMFGSFRALTEPRSGHGSPEA